MIKIAVLDDEKDYLDIISTLLEKIFKIRYNINNEI